MGYALMQIPGGWLADRFGSRKVIVAAVMAWSIFTALSGLAWSLTSLLLIRFLFGICLVAAVIACFLPVGKKSQTATDYSAIETVN